MKKKKIFFRPISVISEQVTPFPVASKKYIPDWYKDLPRYYNNGLDNNGIKDPFNTKTAKTCLPFFDSISAGYLYLLPYDIFCTFDKEGNRVVRWGETEFQVIGKHNDSQIGDYPIPNGYEKEVFKFNTTWAVQTPKEYSCLYMHPLGRFDLPFYSLHGIVDSDIFWKNINLPFVIKENFEGVIEQGTPISQIIPIKRDSWLSEIKSFKDDGYDPNIDNLKGLATVEKFYKKNFWNKKYYN